MYNENTQYEESIDLVLLCVSILRKWKALIIAVLIGAVLLGAYKAVIRPEPAASEAEITELQTVIDSSDAAILTNETELVTNANNIEANSNRIAANERLLVRQGLLEDMLNETLEASQNTLAAAQKVLADPNATVEETANVIVLIPTLVDEVTNAANRISSNAQQIRNYENEIAAWQDEISTWTERNAALEQSNEVLRAELSEQRAQMVEMLNGDAGLKPVVTYAALGAFLGAIVVCGITLLQMLLSKKLHTADELKEQFGFPILGSFGVKREKAGKFTLLLDRLSGLDQKMPDEQLYALIAAGIRAPAVPQPMKLVVTGTVDEVSLKKMGDELAARLPEGYELTVAQNPAYNAELLADLKRYTVLLVEAKAVSDKREIAKLAEILRRNEIKVIGAVAL